jgi:hypothetical protein
MTVLKRPFLTFLASNCETHLRKRGRENQETEMHSYETVGMSSTQQVGSIR